MIIQIVEGSVDRRFKRHASILATTALIVVVIVAKVLIDVGVDDIGVYTTGILIYALIGNVILFLYRNRLDRLSNSLFLGSMRYPARLVKKVPDEITRLYLYFGSESVVVNLVPDPGRQNSPIDHPGRFRILSRYDWDRLKRYMKTDTEELNVENNFQITAS